MTTDAKVQAMIGELSETACDNILRDFGYAVEDYDGKQEKQGAIKLLHLERKILGSSIVMEWDNDEWHND